MTNKEILEALNLLGNVTVPEKFTGRVTVTYNFYEGGVSTVEKTIYEKVK